MNKFLATFVLLIIGIAIGWNMLAEATQEKASSRSYVGHENDQDIQNFIGMYPAAAGTRLDDCQRILLCRHDEGDALRAIDVDMVLQMKEGRLLL